MTANSLATSSVGDSCAEIMRVVGKMGEVEPQASAMLAYTVAEVCLGCARNVSAALCLVVDEQSPEGLRHWREQTERAVVSLFKRQREFRNDGSVQSSLLSLLSGHMRQLESVAFSELSPSRAEDLVRSVGNCVVLLVRPMLLLTSRAVEWARMAGNGHVATLQEIEELRQLASAEGPLRFLDPLAQQSILEAAVLCI